ncbi:MAG TPA: hypothetical protein ENI80_11420 [Acidiferrobacteraceae bacterium]|nr:hypothetical protein [Acidiferrobacteraceae bacterium]
MPIKKAMEAITRQCWIAQTRGPIVADNVLWSGAALHPQQKSDYVLANFNNRVLEDQRTEQVMLPVRDSVLLIRKK